MNMCAARESVSFARGVTTPGRPLTYLMISASISLLRLGDEMAVSHVMYEETWSFGIMPSLTVGTRSTGTKLFAVDLFLDVLVGEVLRGTTPGRSQCSGAASLWAALSSSSVSASSSASLNAMVNWYAWPSTHVRYELIGAGMLIVAGNGRGLPFDCDEWSAGREWVRARDAITQRRAVT